MDEYAFFAFFGGGRPNPTFEDYFGPEDKTRSRAWDSLLRGGSGWTRAARPNLCYPILVDADENGVTLLPKPAAKQPAGSGAAEVKEG